MTKPNIKRVVFSGDFLRPNAAGNRPTQHNNIRWLQNLLSAPLAMATGLPQSVISWGVDSVADGGLTTADVRAYYRHFGLDLSLQSWARIHDLPSLPPHIEALIDSMFGDSLVVGFEIPPSIENYLTWRGIPLISATIHPVRFLDDIFLAIRSNIPAIQDKLFGYRIDQNYIRLMAGIQSASAARAQTLELKPNSALLVMQTWYDQTQIRNGEFVSCEYYLDEIARIASEHSELLVKEHPLAPNPATMLIQSVVPNLRMVTGNAYGFLASPEVTKLVTMSSSVGVEAPYFDIPTHFLLRRPMEQRITETDPPEGFIGIEDAFMAPDFWRTTLAPIVSVSAKDKLTVPRKPNRLRIALRSFWNFNQIDTDIPVAEKK